MNSRDISRKCVLLVDDDPDIRAVVGEILESEGYEVVRAADGAAALRQLRGGLRPGLILLDLMMPGMNGWEFREIQRREPGLDGIPIVVLSGTDRLIRSAAALGANEVLPKPVELDTLLAVVRRHCGDRPA